METSMADALLEVSLYVRGVELDVSRVSASMGVQPSEVMIKGTPKSKSRATPVHSATTWVHSQRSNSTDISSEIIRLLESFDHEVRPLDLPQVDDAFIDVFLAVTVEEDRLSSSIDWVLSAAAAEAVAHTGLPVHFSMCNVTE